MNLNLIYSTLRKVFDLYDFAEISSSITEVHTSLTNLTDQPENPEFQMAYVSSEEQLLDSLKPENFASLTEFDVETLQHAGLTRLLPGDVLSNIKKSKTISELTPSVIAETFKEIGNLFDIALVKAASLKSTLEKLGAEDIFDPNKAYLAFIMSSPDYNGEYGEFVKDQGDFEKGLRLILNGANVKDKTLKLHALSNTDPLIVIGISVTGMLTICKVLQEIFKTIQECKKIELFETQIKSEKNKNKTLEAELSKHKDEKQKQAVTVIANLFVGKGDGEKQSSLEQGIKLFLKSIAKGHGVDIIAGEYQEPDTNDDGSPAQDGETVLSKADYLELVDISRDIRKLAGNEVPQYLLEAPETRQPPNDTEEE